MRVFVETQITGLGKLHRRGARKRGTEQHGGTFDAGFDEKAIQFGAGPPDVAGPPRDIQGSLREDVARRVRALGVMPVRDLRRPGEKASWTHRQRDDGEGQGEQGQNPPARQHR